MDATVGGIADAALMRRLERLARGEQPRVLDMFSGAGGISRQPQQRPAIQRIIHGGS